MGPLNPTRVKIEMGGGRLREMQTPSKGVGMYALAIAKCIRVDYEAMEVTLITMLGEDDLFQRVPIPLSFPGAGPRHFLGAMPERGSYCVIGYLPSEPHKIPVVLSWVVPGTQLGYDWVPTQEFEPTEFDFTPRRRTELEGIYERTRRKLRHMAPGNIVASSSQGSDLVLDESVLLTNRRANEIRIRDQDQAIVTRSQTRFDVQGGVRVYAGPVQRDATLLPLQVVSDGLDWADFRQRIANQPIPVANLGPETKADRGGFIPHNTLHRPEGAIPSSGVDFGENLDPYDFLAKGLFINRSGYIISTALTTDGGSYQGKRWFRPSFDPTSNPNLSRVNAGDETEAISSEALTEYRIEVNHTWDQTLPVSEQTEGLDADRLPPSPQDETNDLLQADKPFVEVVYGTVTGNDAFSSRGREQYGVPIRPVIFDEESGAPTPSLESGLDFDINTHAATLLKVDPPLLADATPTFFTVLKNGQVRASVGGQGAGNSIELALAGGMRVVAGAPIFFEAVGGVCFRARGGTTNANLAYEIAPDTGGVKIAGGGKITEGSLGATVNPNDGGTDQLPHLHLDSPNQNGVTWLTANKDILIAGGDTLRVTRFNNVDFTPKNLLRILTDKVGIQAGTIDKTITGQSIELYSGPRNFSPANAPLRSVTFAGTPLTGHAGGTTDKYTMVFGDREERFLIGNHETTVLVGNQTYQSVVGNVTMRAGVNQLKIATASGLQAVVPVGVMSMVATSAAVFKGIASVTVSSQGPAVLSGTITTLGGSGKVGGIVCQTDLDPLSGFPLGFLGLGSPGHVLAPPLA